MKEQFINLLKQSNLSLTPVRLAVLEAVHQHPHSDAAKIFAAVQQKVSTTSIQAVYNNLHAFVEEGIVCEIKPKGQVALYETRVGDNHHHLVCRSCAQVIDVDCKIFAPCLSPVEDHGFMIYEAEVVFWGVCPSCQKNLQEKETGEQNAKNR